MAGRRGRSGGGGAAAPALAAAALACLCAALAPPALAQVTPQDGAVARAVVGLEAGQTEAALVITAPERGFLLAEGWPAPFNGSWRIDGAPRAISWTLVEPGFTQMSDPYPRGIPRPDQPAGGRAGLAPIGALCRRSSGRSVSASCARLSVRSIDIVRTPKMLRACKKSLAQRRSPKLSIDGRRR